MSGPLVSILIPCYNAAPWLAQTLESALAQTWPHREIILVNDGSTDDSLTLARSFAARGVTVIDQPNGGQSAAFNRAIAAARGEFLEFLDADDLLAPDKLERQVEFLTTAGPDVMIAGAWTRFTSDPTAKTFLPDALWTDSLAPIDWLVTAWRQNLMMHGAAWLIPASLVRRAGGWNEELGLINDLEFFSRLMLATPRVRFCPAARSYYRSELPHSLSRARSPRACLSAFTSISLGTARLLAAEDSPRTRDASAFAFRQFCFETYPLAPELRARAEARVRELGHELGQPAGGPVFRLLTRAVGWRLARRLQNFSYRLGYKQLAARWRQP